MAVDLVAVSRHLEQTLGVPPLVRVNGKRPLDPQWTTGPRSDPVGWRRRLERHEGNVGVLTGDGLVVIDADLYHHGAEDALDGLYDAGLPRFTVTAITGGGGRHLYYATELAIPSRPLEGCEGVDVKAEGGMVVVPPSVHPSGRSYEWEYGYGPGDVELAELPASIVELLGGGPQRRAQGAVDERDERALALLVEHFGAHSPHHREHWIEVTRPGKTIGASATIGAVGRGVTRVWSTNWSGLPAGVYSTAELRRLAGVEEPKVKVPKKGGLRLRRASSVEMAAVEWMWPARITLGSLVLLAGREGTGKGILASWLSANVTAGTLPGALDGRPSSVLWLGTEDSLTTTLTPRWKAAGADLDRIVTLELDGSDATELAPERLGEVVQLATDEGVRLVVLDPLISSVPLSHDAWKEQHMRAALLPWRNFAEATGATVLGLTHFGKGHNNDALTAILNSRAITAAARSVLVVGFDPEEDPPTTRVVVVRKSNLGRLDVPGFSYRVEEASLGVDAKGRPITAGYLTSPLEREAPPSAESMMHPGEHTPPTARDEAKQFLLAMLHEGEQLAKAVIDQATKEDIAERTLKRAKTDLGVIVRREGFGPGSRLFWSLPPIEGQETHRGSHSNTDPLWDSWPPMDDEPPGTRRCSVCGNPSSVLFGFTPETQICRECLGTEQGTDEVPS